MKKTNHSHHMTTVCIDNIHHRAFISNVRFLCLFTQNNIITM